MSDSDSFILYDIGQLSSAEDQALYVPVEITNRVFTTALLNPANEAYQTLYNEVTDLLKGIYDCKDSNTCPTNVNFRGVVGMTFSAGSGSVIANATMLFVKYSVNPMVAWSYFEQNVNNTNSTATTLPSTTTPTTTTTTTHTTLTTTTPTPTTFTTTTLPSTTTPTTTTHTTLTTTTPTTTTSTTTTLPLTTPTTTTTTPTTTASTTTLLPSTTTTPTKTTATTYTTHSIRSYNQIDQNSCQNYKTCNYNNPNICDYRCTSSTHLNYNQTFCNNNFKQDKHFYEWHHTGSNHHENRKQWWQLYNRLERKSHTRSGEHRDHCESTRQSHRFCFKWKAQRPYDVRWQQQ
nr:PREDICTED: integumentary mucin C.1-like [Stegastes partitus]